MKIRWLGLVLLACHPKAKPVAEDAAPPPSASVAVVSEAGSPPAPQKPLAWGTRPPEKGPLFPIIDGLCGGGTIRALEGKTIYTEGRTFARFEDEGLVVDPSYEKNAESSRAEAWANTSFNEVSGTWPRLVLFSTDSGLGRMRSFQSIWVHEDAGWSYFGSSEEKGEPAYARPTQFKDWLVTSRHAVDAGGNGDASSGAGLIHAWPMKKDAPPIAALASLGRKSFSATSIEAAGDSLYAFGFDTGGEGARAYNEVVRVLRDGKVSEGANPHGVRAVVGRRGDALFVLGGDGVIRRFDGAKATALPFKPKPGALIVGASLSPNGDTWALTSKSEILVLRDGVVTATALPASTAKSNQTLGEHGPETGFLAGVEYDDPHATSESGTLFHLENGEWREVPLPSSPFATNGRYQVERLTMAAKGDLIVSVGYSEKGLGWKTPLRYHGVLRTRRPRETLRCNEAPLKYRVDREEVGHGFFSAPPLADDTCPTPFVVLLRLGSKEKPNFLYDRGYPTLRAAIQETPGLGATASILEVGWGDIQVAGMKAPDMATAKELALNAAKRVKSEFLETHPEIVCGVPPVIAKTMAVDVATGKFVTADAN